MNTRTINEIMEIDSFGTAKTYKEIRTINEEFSKLIFDKAEIVNEILSFYPKSDDNDDVNSMDEELYEFTLEAIELGDNIVLIQDVFYKKPLFVVTVFDRHIDLEIFIYPKRPGFYEAGSQKPYYNGEIDCHYFYYEYLSEIIEDYESNYRRSLIRGGVIEDGKD